MDGNVSPQRSLINLSDNEQTDLKPKQQPATGQLIDVSDEVDGKGSGVNVAEKTVPMASVLLNLNTNSPNHSTGASPKVRPPQLQNKISQSGSTPKRTPRSHTSATNKRWNPPMLLPLPTGFLRLNPVTTGGNTIALPYDPNRDFDLPDEQFAMMLQNEEFMNQLRWNQEFMNALEKEQTGKDKAEGDADFKERLKHMGKVSRKKFLQMARVFTWQRNKKTTTAKQIDSLPLKEEPSDDEDHHHHSRNTNSEQSHTQNTPQQQRK